MKKILLLIGITLALLFFGMVVCFAQNKPISALLVATTPLAGTELVPVVQNGITKQTTIGAIGSTMPCCPLITGNPATTGNIFLGSLIGNPLAFSGSVNNVGIGSNSATSFTTASFNSIFGNAVMPSTTTGSSNVGFGSGVLSANTTGSFITAVGTNTLSSNVTGNNLTAVGSGIDVASGALNNSIALGSGAEITASDQLVVGSASAPVSNWVVNNVPYVMPSAQGAASTVLTNDGSGTLTWAAASGTGTVTSIAAGTGLTGGTITGSGTIALSTPVAVANGGTGQTTATAAVNALLPSQSGNGGKYLTTNGTSASWGTPSTSPALTSSYIGYGNGSNLLTGDADFTRNAWGINISNSGSLPDIFINGGNGSTTGADNIGIGNGSLTSITGSTPFYGYENVAIGSSAMENSTTASYCVAIGYQALKSNVTGVRLICIGRYSDVDNVSTHDNSIAIGESSVITASNQFVVGSSGHPITQWVINTVPYNFPSAQGAASSVLTNDGSGNLSWSTVGGSTPIYPPNQIPYGDGSTDGGITSGQLTYNPGESFVNSTDFLINNVASEPLFEVSANNSTGDVKTITSYGTFDVPTGKTEFNSVPYQWPGTQGSTNSTLTNDGSGNLSWAAPTQNIQLLGKLTGADLNTGYGVDQPITLNGGTNYVITNVVYTNVSADLTSTGFLQTVINTGPSGSGNYIEFENEFVAFLSSSDQFLDWNVANTISEMEHIQPYAWMGFSSPFLGHVATSPIYFSDLVPAGLTATCDIYVFGYVLN